MIKVLLVEDDLEIARIIKYYLAQEDIYEVIWASDCQQALRLARDSIDICLIDVMLPDENGIKLCQQLRQYHKCPILFISCIDDQQTIIDALESGGDDYIVKPFDHKILSARIMANLRRVKMEHQQIPQHYLHAKNFLLDTHQHCIIKEDQKIALIPLEYQILSLLMTNPNKAFKASEIYRIIWGKSSYGDNRTVVVHIHNIRKKCEIDPSNPQIILSLWGKGYAFNP